MKKLLGFFVCLAICFPFVYGVPAQSPTSSPAIRSANVDETGYYAYSYARMSYVNGDVYIQRAGDLGYEQGVVNLAIVEGDKLGTRDGRTEIHFGRKNYLRIDRFTQIDMVGLPKQGLDVVKLHLLSGNIFLRVNYLEREKDFEIHTPDGSFYILQEGLYNVSVSESSDTDFRVLEGLAEAAGETGSVLVEAEQKVVVSNGNFLSQPTYFAGLGEDFSEWNRSRDALHNRPVSSTYLPEELHEYENELADNGRWIYEREYGYVWVPRVYHDTWSPYWNGRWVWYPIIGWNWVSYDSWGWCVHHYGRWHWRLGLGWYWIPTRYWGPSWVHWYHGYDYYGWCPLSYWGYPGVIINNHYYGRYYGHYYPVHSRSFMMVHRDHFRSHRISKYALSQNARRGVGKIRLSSLQPKIRPQINRTQMRNSPGAKVLARTNVRKVGKAYTSKGLAVTSGRSSTSKVRATSGRTLGTSTLRKGSAVSKGTVSRSSSSSRIKTGTSSMSSRSAVSKTARTTSSRSAIKTYPSQRSNGSRSLTRPGSSSRLSRLSSSTRALPKLSSSRSSSSSSRSTTARKIKSYSSSSRINSSSSRTIKSRVSSPEASRSSRSSSVYRSRSSSSAISKIYRSRSSASSSNLTRSRRSSATSSRYSTSTPSRSQSSSRNTYSSSRSRTPSTSYSSRSLSSSRVRSTSRSYSTPSRSASSRRVSSPRISSSSRSSSPSRVSSSRSRSLSSSRSRVSSSSSRSRSLSSSRRSSSSSRVSRSSRSSGKVRKK